MPRKVAIDPVGNGQENEKQGGNDLLLAMPAVWKMRRQHPDKHWNAEDAAHRDGIGEVHAGAPLLSLCTSHGGRCSGGARFPAVPIPGNNDGRRVVTAAAFFSVQRPRYSSFTPKKNHGAGSVH